MVGEDKKNAEGKWLKYLPKVDGNQIRTYSYIKWGGMVVRCKDGGMYKNLHPSYNLCTMSDEFKCFQVFTDWIREQVGYGFSEYQLDKDLFKQGNPVYSRETCVLLPKQLNLFLLDRSLHRGAYAQGVSFDQRSKKFVAYVSDMGVNRYLGRFISEDDAFQVYKREKEIIAKLWYERVTNGTFRVDERVAEKLRTWTINS